MLDNSTVPQAVCNAGVRTPVSRPRRKRKTDFPLRKHTARGYWCKKVRGKLRYFGKIADDPDGQKAIAEWLRTKDYLLAGREPPPPDDNALTVGVLCNRFLDSKEQKRDEGAISHRHFVAYKAVCERLGKVFGWQRRVDDLRPDDFSRLRKHISKTSGLVRLANEIQRTRSVFLYAFTQDLIEKPVKFGEDFQRRGLQAAIDRKRVNEAPRMFDAPEIQRILAGCNAEWRALVLLAINCAFGPSDLGQLPLSALDLKDGWVTFPRPKTAKRRRCWLWVETREAVKAAIAERPEPKHEADGRLVFLTKFKTPWHKPDSSSTPLAAEFTKLLRSIDAAAEKEAAEKNTKPPARLYRTGAGLYWLRHTFRTVADELRDTPAIDCIMGHKDPTMARHYREGLPADERLRAVAQNVRCWLFGKGVDGGN